MAEREAVPLPGLARVRLPFNPMELQENDHANQKDYERRMPRWRRLVGLTAAAVTSASAFSSKSAE
jgi:hypothetical protein